jgi:hypothetical protein
MIFAPNKSKSGTTAGAAAVEIQHDMAERRQYRLSAKGALWFKIIAPGGTAATIAGDDCHYLADGRTFDVGRMADRTRVSIIRDGSTDVVGCLSEIGTIVG